MPLEVRFFSAVPVTVASGSCHSVEVGAAPAQGHGRRRSYSTLPHPLIMSLAQSEKSQGAGDSEVVKKCPDRVKYPLWRCGKRGFLATESIFSQPQRPQKVGK